MHQSVPGLSSRLEKTRRQGEGETRRKRPKTVIAPVFLLVSPSPPHFIFPSETLELFLERITKGGRRHDAAPRPGRRGRRGRRNHRFPARCYAARAVAARFALGPAVSGLPGLGRGRSRERQ